MRSIKFVNHAVLPLSVVVLLIVITYAYGAATLSSSTSPSSLSPSSLIRPGQRKLSQQESGDFDITPYKKGAGSNRNRGSRRNGGNKRKGVSKRNGGSKKNKWGGGKNSRNRAKLNFTSSCECGKKFTTTRIIGGVPATRYEYPWQAALFVGGDFGCGGTLINNRFVLTAAHCVHEEKASNVTVRLREHRLSTTDQAMEIEKSVAKIIIHKDYDSVTTRNDIALLEFNEAIVFPTSTSLRPICLPSTTSELYVGDKATATGWGLTDPTVPDLPDVLREVELKVVSEEVCKSFYNTGLIKKTNICAGKRNKNICFGDSGGPLAYENSDARYEQIGITSFTLNCGLQQREPAVFTRVNSYLRWIKRKTKSATYCSGFTFP